jgi:spoIIIJ-associated protein
MKRDFEGKTEQEAIALAVAELQIDREDFDVEILDPGKRGLFKKGPVKIRIHFNEDPDTEEDLETEDPDSDIPVIGKPHKPLAVSSGFEQDMVDFISTLLVKMGYPGTVDVDFRKEGKLGINIVSNFSSIIIGRKGKNLDAIQLIANVYAGQKDANIKIIIDSENYRMRHEEQLVRLAYKTAEQVKRNGKSRLLEPMNPFERRLVHTALNDMEGIQTKSEGEGLYKQVRISCDDELPPIRF